MKKIVHSMLIMIYFMGNHSYAQNVGIGTSNPQAGLHVLSNNGIIASGTYNTGAVIDETGAASRFIFNPKKGAIRGGYLDASGANFWDDASTGSFSIGFGYNAKASGYNAIAIGQGSLSTQTNSLALGYAAQATGANSVSLGGVASTASQQFSVAIGNYVNANAFGSVAIGRNINAGYSSTFGQNAYCIGIGDNSGFTTGGQYATGNRAFVFGNNSRSVGNRSFAIGNDCTSGQFFEEGTSGRYAFSLGNSCTASGIFSFAFGNNANTNGRTGAMVLGSRVDGVGVISPADFHFLAQFAGGYQLQSNNAGTLGVYLNPNTSSWASLCDSNKKEQVLALNDKEVLKKISAIDYYSWKYKDDPDSQNRHYGIMAQDFYAAFGEDALGKIGSDTLVNPIDLLGIAYSAIKALEKRTAEWEQVSSENRELKTRLERLEAIVYHK